MRTIVDGYNVIFRMVRRPLQYDSGQCERLRTELLEELERFRVRTGEEFTVVFDGGPGGAHLARHQHFGGLEVIFSDPGSDADEEIKGLIRESSGARDLRVVTDDGALAGYVRRFRVKVSGAEELLARMRGAERRQGEESDKAEPPCKFTGPEPYEVDDWVNEFGDVEDEDADEE
jgi:predicted RNA-binding protein with PIN domain